MEKKARLVKDLVCSGISVFLGVFLIYFIKDFIGTSQFKQETVNSTFMPRVVGIALIGLGVILAVKTLLEYQKALPDVDKVPQIDRKAKMPAGKGTGSFLFNLFANHADILSLILLFFWVFSWQNMGFIIATVIYAFLEMVIMAPREKLTAKNTLFILVISIVATFLIYFLFTRVFTVPLPKGMLKFL